MCMNLNKATKVDMEGYSIAQKFRFCLDMQPHYIVHSKHVCVYVYTYITGL